MCIYMYHYFADLGILSGLPIHVNLSITLSLVSIDTDRVIFVKTCYNEVIYYRHVISLGAMTWSYYIENCIIVRHVIMRLNCTQMLSLCAGQTV